MSDNRFDYEGKSADVHWDGRLCIHIGECGHAKGDLFTAGRQPWCQPDLVDVAEVAEVVARCPTGALTYTRHGEASQDEAAPAAGTADENTVTVSNHGPLYVRGDLDIEGVPDDMLGVRTRAALCRCGKSKNKPFCDNSHEEEGFKDRGAVGEAGAGFDEAGGKLVVKRVKNGPLLLRGNVTMLAASGRVAWKGTKTALCRCGESKNKPFCDGSHRAAGFEAD